MIVGDDVVELRGRLVVPTAPSGAAVDADGGALIAREQEDLRILGVDPDGVVIIAAGRAFDGGERMTAIGGAVGGSVADVDGVFVIRRDADPGEIEAASPDALFIVHALEIFAGVVGTKKPSDLRSVREGENAIRIIRRDADSDAAKALFIGGQAFADGAPSGAAIG